MLFAVVLNLRELLGREAKHWPIAINRSILFHRNSKLFCSILHTITFSHFLNCATNRSILSHGSSGSILVSENEGISEGDDFCLRRHMC